jgi:tellurite resistance protein TerC
VKAQQEDGSFGDPVVNTFVPLALLASGRPEHLKAVERNVRFHARTTKPVDDDSLINWRYMTAAIVMSEYCLATNEAWVVPELVEVRDFLYSTQYLSRGTTSRSPAERPRPRSPRVEGLRRACGASSHPRPKWRRSSPFAADTEAFYDAASRTETPLVIWIWIAFLAFVLLLLALDLGVFHRKVHVVSVREALAWSAVWIALGVAFSVFVGFAYERHWMGIGLAPDPVDGVVNGGRSALVKYLTAYVVEKSLSVDNIFVIAMLFSFFAIPAIYQHRVLFWGILGALVMRGAMIAVGTQLIARFHWLLWIFGAFLIVTALKMLFIRSAASDPNLNIVVRLTRRLIPVTTRLHGEHFVVRAGTPASHDSELPGGAPIADAAADRLPAGTRMITPLALALLMVETTDLIFAVDSIPAVFAITADPFLVFTSNVFAMLGLRSLYFALAGLMDRFRFLKLALGLVLLVVGVKMIAAEWFKAWLGKNFNVAMLATVLGILAAGVVASLLVKPRRERDRAGG